MAVAVALKEADDALGMMIEAADRLRLIEIAILALQATERAVAIGEWSVGALVVDDEDAGGGVILGEVDRLAPEITILIRADDLDHGDFGQGAAAGETPATAAIDLAVALKILDQGFQWDAVGAAQVEGAGDLALADRTVLVLDEGQHLFLGGEGDGLGLVGRLGFTGFRAGTSPGARLVGFGLELPELRALSGVF